MIYIVLSLSYIICTRSWAIIIWLLCIVDDFGKISFMVTRSQFRINLVVFDTQFRNIVRCRVGNADSFELGLRCRLYYLIDLNGTMHGSGTVVNVTRFAIVGSSSEISLALGHHG